MAVPLVSHVPVPVSTNSPVAPSEVAAPAWENVVAVLKVNGMVNTALVLPTLTDPRFVVGVEISWTW
jgi:hypothetical protein